MSNYKQSLKSNNTRLANIAKALEEKTFAGKYSLEIEILDYEGNPMSMSGYYYKPKGAETYFSGDTAIPNIANEETVLYIVILNVGSPNVSGYGCSVTYDVNLKEIDGIEYYACEITARNFTNDALIRYQEG